jgi:hypothetical protein
MYIRKVNINISRCTRTHTQIHDSLSWFMTGYDLKSSNEDFFIQLWPEEDSYLVMISNSGLKKNSYDIFCLALTWRRVCETHFFTHTHLPATMWILVQLGSLYLNTARWNECDLYKKNKSNLVQTFIVQSIYLYASEHIKLTVRAMVAKMLLLSSSKQVFGGILLYSML